MKSASARPMLTAAFFALLPQAAQGQALDFKTYPTPLYTGPRVAPNFAGSAAQLKMYRTAITQGFFANSMAAGHYTIITVGCGTGCTEAWLGDVRSGKIFEFPIGGEFYQGLHISGLPTDRQISASWSSDATMSDCIMRTYLFDGVRFRQLGPDSKYPTRCG